MYGGDRRPYASPEGRLKPEIRRNIFGQLSVEVCGIHPEGMRNGEKFEHIDSTLTPFNVGYVTLMLSDFCGEVDLPHHR